MGQDQVYAGPVISSTCISCKSTFSYEPAGRAGRRRLFCSPPCREIRVNQQWASYRLSEHRKKIVAKGKGKTCSHCGGGFVSYHRGARFCGQACAKASTRIYANRAERVASEASRRRARKRTTQVERFSKIEIYERDGWICQLCGKPVDQELEPPAHMSASLDHRVPLAKGGAHTRENSQCAHWICNSLKGDR